MAVTILPATADRWEDIVRVFGIRGDDPSWCWCRRFLTQPDGPAGTDNRSTLRREVAEAATPPGLIASVDGVPVGWTRVGPRSRFPGVTSNRALARVLYDDPDAWWVTCFAIDGRHRRSGVGSALLLAAVDFARDHGASAVEGHPVDVAGLTTDTVSGSALFTGTMTMYVAAGFAEIARTYPTRPVMRLPLAR
ncbi:GNAT family N-acetyltransferase [Leifsonia sp. NPDC058248]|uniref:GNAT family N-acetyltransferase n=1 Tax=Leifsonia sp. NPDC058248 TaxID=3346402 RepID=UPI0036DA2168